MKDINARNEYLEKLANQFELRFINYVPESAWLGHGPFMRYLIAEMKPKVFVELGSHNGFSYFAACEKAKELRYDHKFYAVDTWEGDAHTGGFSSSIFQNVKEQNFSYVKSSTLMQTTFNQAVSQFEESSINLLHIDGLHTESAVTEDFENWLPKMRTDGVILFHDICVRHQDFGVFKLWEKLKLNYSYLEFPHSYGLGVLFLGKIPSKGLKDLVELGSLAEHVLYQGVFGAHGDGVLQSQLRRFEHELTLLKTHDNGVKAVNKRKSITRLIFGLLPIKVKNYLKSRFLQSMSGKSR
jgi:predicted O-methyltransferase YrrM